MYQPLIAFPPLRSAGLFFTEHDRIAQFIFVIVMVYPGAVMVGAAGANALQALSPQVYTEQTHPAHIIVDEHRSIFRKCAFYSIFLVNVGMLIDLVSLTKTPVNRKAFLIPHDFRNLPLKIFETSRITRHKIIPAANDSILKLLRYAIKISMDKWVNASVFSR